MKKNLMISGMTCDHCVRHVTNALEEVPGIQSVSVSLADNRAVVEAEESVTDEALKEAVEEVGYTVTAIS